MTGARSMHARVWRLAGPIILSNLSVPLLGAVDTAVMGHLPDPAYIGSVAIGGLVFSYIYWGFGFLRMGTTGFVAQAEGAKDADEIRAVLARGLLLAAGFDPDGVDGIIGPNTIAAVKAFQASIGMIPDGYASLEILKRLR